MRIKGNDPKSKKGIVIGRSVITYEMDKGYQYHIKED